MIRRLKSFTSASSLRRNLGMTLGRQLLAAFAHLLLVAMVARELGPEGNGHYAMAILVPTLLASLLNLGVGPATVYYVSRGDFNIRQAMTGNMKLGLVVAIVGTGCMLPLLWGWGADIFPSVPKNLLYLGLVGFPVTLLLAYLNTVLQGLEDFRAFNLTVLLPPYINLAGVFFALYILSYGVAGAVVAHILGQAIGLFVVIYMLNKKRKIEPILDESKVGFGYTGRVLTYGWKAHLSNVTAFINYRADIFLVNFFLTPVATGVYVIAVQISEKLWMLSQAASTVLLPRLSAMHETPRARLALTNKGFIVVSAITLVASICVAISLSWLINPIFGEEYEEVVPLLWWLLPGIIAGAGSRIFANCIAAAGKPEWNMYSSFGMVAINVVGNVILVPEYGIVGAAWATSLAYCFNTAVKAWQVRRLNSVRTELHD